MRAALSSGLVLLLVASSVAEAQRAGPRPASARKKRRDGEGPGGERAGGGLRKGELVQLIVACATPGASVFVDGEMIGQSPIDLPVPVTSGDHSIKVTRPGYAPFIDVFSTRGRAELRLDVELVPVAGVLHVTSNVPGARVLLDGRYVGDAPLEVEADVGARAVQVSKGGYHDFFQNVMAVAGQELNLDVKLEELPAGLNPYKPLPPPPPRWYQKGWVWGVIAAGAVVAAGATVGIVLGTRPYDLCTKSDTACLDVPAPTGAAGH